MTDESGRGQVVSVLLALEGERASGVLDFRAADVPTRVFVEEGTPIFAEAGTHGETLGNVLVRERMITEEQFAAVVRRMTDALVDDENVRFGEVVVELGLLSKEEVESALATQVEKKIIGAIHRGEGEWTFAAGRDRVEGVARHPSPVRTLLLDAAANFSEERVAALVPGDRFPRTARPTADVARDYGLDPAELAIVQRLDGTRSAREIDAGPLLAALVLGGAVEMRERPAETSAPAAAVASITATGRRRAFVRTQSIARERAKASIERFIREREAPLPKARNEREATLFAEDEFQSGKRLLAQGNVEAARAKLASAVELAPAVTLYRLHKEFADSRTPAGFADAAATKKLAMQTIKEDPEQAFAFYVLGHLALGDRESAATKRFFKQAFKIDPELVDAGRQARLLELRPGSVPDKAGAASGSRRALILAVALAVVVLAAVAAFALKK